MPNRDEFIDSISEDRGDDNQTSFWNTILNKLSESKKATDITASGIRTINELGEAGVPGAEGLMNWIDDKAFKLGRVSGQGTVSEKNIDAALDYGLEFENYKGMGDGGSKSSKLYQGSEDPNILRIFLGMDENTLAESEHKPSSWTKGEPEQGWRSVKEFSDFKTYSATGLTDDAGNKIRPGASESELERIRDSSLGKKINKMRDAVSSGEYTPELAVKGRDYGEGGNFPGIDYESRIDMGHMTESIGYDEDKGQYYMSAADVWDFEPELYTKLWGDGGAGRDDKQTYLQSSLMQASGKSIGLYDRYYLDDSYMDDWYGSRDKVPDDMEGKLMFAMAD